MDGLLVPGCVIPEHQAQSGGTIDPVQSGMAKVQLAGVQLDEMALAALVTLPPEHACEMLDYVAENTGHLRNPSKYITGTVKRGFMSRASVGVSATPFGFAGAPRPRGPAPLGSSAVLDLKLQLRAQELTGLTLTPEAVGALAHLPREHSDELLEFVAEKRLELRDPSNYIASTVARGFVSRRSTAIGTSSWAPAGGEDVARALQRCQALAIDVDEMARHSLGTVPPSHAVELLEHVLENHTSLRNVSSYVSRTISRGFVSRYAPITHASSPYASKGAGKVGWNSHSSLAPSLMPQDMTQLESRILNYNSSAVQAGQMLIDMTTYLALRCVSDWHAAELLDTLEAKVGHIQSPCNYIQAAVTKTHAGKGGGGQAGYHGAAWNPNGGGFACAVGFGGAMDGFPSAGGHGGVEVCGATGAWASGTLPGEGEDSLKRQRLW